MNINNNYAEIIIRPDGEIVVAIDDLDGRIWTDEVKIVLRHGGFTIYHGNKEMCVIDNVFNLLITKMKLFEILNIIVTFDIDEHQIYPAVVSGNPK